MKRICRAVFLPPVWFRWSFGIVSITAVLCVFLLDLFSAPIAYAVFLASALGFYYLITVTVIPLAQRIKAWLMANRYIKRYYEDMEFNARITLYWGILLNVLYAAFKLVTGIYFRSEWLIAIAVYYGILIALKYTLAHQDLRSIRRNTALDEIKQWRLYRRVGALMLLMNVGLSGITVQVVGHNESFSYPGTVIFVMAAYSFYRITIAITRLLTGRENRSPIFSAAKVIDVSFAVTAMFTLQTAMFASFAKGLDTRVPNIITGTAVAVIITTLAVIMIVRARKKLKRVQETPNQEEDHAAQM